MMVVKKQLPVGGSNECVAGRGLNLFPQVPQLENQLRT